MKWTRIASFFLLLNLSIAWSAGALNIVVVGLFSGQAVLTINNQQHLLKVGKTSPEGVKLISATSRSAVLEVDGVQQKYLLGEHISSHFKPPVAQPMVSIWPTNGMYVTTGSVNGFSVDFLVDTGASTIALNAATAKRLGLDYLNGKEIKVRTASEIETAYEVTLDKVQIGDIKLTNVRAMVLDGPEPSQALLGMTFLGQLNINQTGKRMDLKKKF
ncbi:MAG: TIGR02281 family clan AA aspartic protease [Methylophaga sp.]|nr:MAG: TIGR02281 family clan AA aspartic protease [Methylophaga sp.]